ncbi:hypothetical protein SLE2022_132330 [Rubroshorea leprosula]
MINEKLKKAKDLVEKGIIDEVQKVLEEAEALKKLPARQEPVLDSSKYRLLMFALPIKSYRFVTFSFRKRETRATNLTDMMRGDQKKEVEIMRENPVVTKGGIMIERAEIVTGTMI